MFMLLCGSLAYNYQARKLSRKTVSILETFLAQLLLYTQGFYTITYCIADSQILVSQSSTWIKPLKFTQI